MYLRSLAPEGSDEPGVVRDFAATDAPATAVTPAAELRKVLRFICRTITAS